MEIKVLSAIIVSNEDYEWEEGLLAKRRFGLVFENRSGL
jgi:hypothetical protein